MLPSFHGSLGFLFWLSLNPFWAMEFFFSLDRFSGVGSSHCPLRALVFFFFFFFFFYSVFFFQARRHRKVVLVITGRAVFFLYILLKPDLCISTGVSTTRAPLWCLPASFGSIASSHGLVGLQCLMRGQHAPRIFSLGSRACGPRSVFQVVIGGSWQPLAVVGFLGIARGLVALSPATTVFHDAGSMIWCFLFWFFSVLV